MAAALTTVDALVDAGLISHGKAAALGDVAARYAISVTPAIAALIDANDPDDPIARQYLPDVAELIRLPEERDDPIGDGPHSPVPGVVHRYPDRVLLKAVHVCPVYCRFCFRREMVGPGGEGTMSGEDLSRAMAYIAGHPEIWEVIVTGGDPLILSPRRLGELMAALGTIEHLKVIRFHSRVPVTDPERITDRLLEALRSSGKTVYVALHANHPRELTADARAAVDRLIEGGVGMVSQSVLLRGVNDDPDVLAALMRGFVEMRVKPYYLHHPDLAPGTSHFRLSIEEGRAIVSALRAKVSGLCMPHYMLDIPGGHGKVPLTESPVSETADGCYVIEDRLGRTHAYSD
ncbi:lysine-2,3-aminomutase-like protein [Rhizobium sp. TH2]|uniref:lysine-2,3-aminomutase-like protein n=1 Tax=Rhizobium sp. TH2 TaxID=2775403 RepID=UPI0021579CBB|nr:lysine-2,3-aminomutase-like protein [Rhizobium sp. TH2]UVC06923.1 lysine-2,3-aminomutase-like protein [Rhizobium sp. TH2]